MKSTLLILGSSFLLVGTIVAAKGVGADDGGRTYRLVGYRSTAGQSISVKQSVVVHVDPDGQMNWAWIDEAHGRTELRGRWSEISDRVTWTIESCWVQGQNRYAPGSPPITLEFTRKALPDEIDLTLAKVGPEGAAVSLPRTSIDVGRQFRLKPLSAEVGLREIKAITSQVSLDNSVWTARQLAAAASVYADDYDQMLPPPKNWEEPLDVYGISQFGRLNKEYRSLGLGFQYNTDILYKQGRENFGLSITAIDRVGQVIFFQARESNPLHIASFKSAAQAGPHGGKYVTVTYEGGKSISEVLRGTVLSKVTPARKKN